MKKFAWIGAILLGAVGVTALLATAQSAPVPVVMSGTVGTLNAGQRTQLQTSVAKCWPHAFAALNRVCYQRGTGNDAGDVFVVVTGQRTLTRVEAEAELVAGRPLRAGRIAEPESYRCLLSGPRLAATGALAASYWSGPLATLRELCIERQGGNVVVTASSGVGTREAADLVTDAENGQDVSPVGAMAP